MSDANQSISLIESTSNVNIQLLVTENKPIVEANESPIKQNKNENNETSTRVSDKADTPDTDDDYSYPDATQRARGPKTQLDLRCPEPNLGSFPYQYLPGPFKYSTHLSYWNIEGHESASKFWYLYGKSIANKNLWISAGNLLFAFSIWLIWSMVTVLLLDSWQSSNGEYYAFNSWQKDMNEHEYHHALWLLPATSGLSGATLRLTNSFMIAPSGGRLVISQTSLLLLVTMLMLATALNNTNVSLEYLIIIALISGAGGGAASSSMSNISFFYPKSKQGLALGLNAGIATLGICIMQLLVPLVVSYPAFGDNSIHIDNVGYISNCAIFWIPFLIVCIVVAWFFMNSLPQHPAAVHTIRALISYYYLEFLGYIGAGCAVIVLIFTHNSMTSHGMHIIQAFILWFIAVIITVLCMKYLLFCGCFTAVKLNKNIQKTLTVLSQKHTWIMTCLYTMTFGSFIGFSASFGLLTAELFPHINPLHYAWLGPFVSSVARPFGGWLADKFGGARVTHYDVIIMILSSIGVACTLIFATAYGHDAHAQTSADNGALFPVFLILFCILFVTTGIGNGSTFRMVSCIFTNKQHVGPILGWISAIAAYGAFVIPIILSESVELGCAEWAFFAFAIYYTMCLIINWWYYYRTGAEKPC